MSLYPLSDRNTSKLAGICEERSAFSQVIDCKYFMEVVETFELSVPFSFTFLSSSVPEYGEDSGAALASYGDADLPGLIMSATTLNLRELRLE